MPRLTPAERSLRGSIAAHRKWAKTDPVEGTAAARAKFLDRFEQEADPDGLLDPQERARRAGHLRKAYFKSLALKSVRARQGGNDAA